MNPKYSFDISNKIDQISQTFCPKKAKNVRKKENSDKIHRFSDKILSETSKMKKAMKIHENVNVSVL